MSKVTQVDINTISQLKIKSSPKHIQIKEPTTGVALFDIHHPYYDENAINAVFQFIKDQKPNILVLGGDQINGDSISHWLENKRRSLENKRIKIEYTNFDKDILTPLEKMSNWKEKVWLNGNHEDWINQQLDNTPQYEGLIEPDVVLKLRKRGWVVKEYNEEYHIGKMVITHGMYTNIHHAKKMCESYEQPIFYGHTHDIQTYTRIFRGGQSLPRIAQSCGCLCKENEMVYLHKKPTNWCHGFLYFTIRPDGKFTAIVFPIIEGKFSFGKKTYG